MQYAAVATDMLEAHIMKLGDRASLLLLRGDVLVYGAGSDGSHVGIQEAEECEARCKPNRRRRWMNYCQYDHNLDEPCGKPARLRLVNLWLCPEHFDETMRFLGYLGVDPFDANRTPPEEKTTFDDGEL